MLADLGQAVSEGIAALADTLADNVTDLVSDLASAFDPGWDDNHEGHAG